jgi:hypothetical protein
MESKLTRQPIDPIRALLTHYQSGASDMRSFVYLLSVVAVLAAPSVVLAQDAEPRTASGASAPAAPIRPRLSFDRAFKGISFTAQSTHAIPQARVPLRPQYRRDKPVWRRIAGAAVGATGGFFGGGFLGAAIEGDSCSCDDPGLKGFLIGAPVGAVAGGILGAMWLF